MGKFLLNDRVALITGGGTGIGRVCAKVLACYGAKVFIVGRREEKLRAVQQEITSSGGECMYFLADLSDETGCKNAVEQSMAQYGRLDILVNNAGSTGANGDLEKEFATENFQKTMAIDFNAAFWMTKYAWKECAKNGKGSIINISSLAALRARGPIVYSAAKGAMRSFSRSMAKRLGKYMVRVNSVYPGFIVTEMTDKIFEHPELEAKYRAESPLGLLGDGEDVAYCVLYLASDAAKFVTGQDFVIDGGSIIE